jgi:hypothetical protein
MSITLTDFWMGRASSHFSEWHEEIEANGRITVERVNFLFNTYLRFYPAARPWTVNSGWRPPSLNARLKGAAPRSKHMTGQAVDIGDDSGDLGRLFASILGQRMLEEAALFMESPSKTPRWVHFQTVPPKSGKRIFIP